MSSLSCSVCRLRRRVQFRAKVLFTFQLTFRNQLAGNSLNYSPLQQLEADTDGKAPELLVWITAG